MTPASRIGVVVTTCAGREDNLRRTLACLAGCHPVEPLALVVVYDGCDAFGTSLRPFPWLTYHRTIPKHQPGLEQPRNVGVRYLREECPEASHVWFLDSDLIFGKDILAKYAEQLAINPNRILIGPYEFLAAGQADMDPNIKTDLRWTHTFDQHGPDELFVNDLGAGLACFGGNLVWPIDEFERLGGFDPDLHHGRCEDGELGLRACEAGIPMSFVREARAWHMFHPVDHAATQVKNARDVPMLNARHPWVQNQGLVVTSEDGARFSWRCPEPGCDMIMNWFDQPAHLKWHQTGEQPAYVDPASVKAVA